MPRSSVALRTSRECNTTSIAEHLLRSTSRILETIFRESGNVGASIGLLEDGNCTFGNLGTRAVDDGQPPTENTTYLISSMTKPFLGLAISLLVADEKYDICFETPVKDVLPELEGKTMLVSDPMDTELTIAHLLAHRSEFLKCTNLWESPDGFVPWTTIDPVLSLLRQMPLSGQHMARPFDNRRNYSNECFALLGEIIERTVSIPWGRFVTEKILRPLQLTNTFTGIPRDHLQDRNNFVASHTVKVDGLISGGHQQPNMRSRNRTEVPKVEPLMTQPSQASFSNDAYEQSPLGAAAGMLSSAKDLLQFYDRFIKAFHRLSVEKHELDHGTSEIERGMITWWKHILSRTQPGDSIYAGGWNTTQIPWSSCDLNHCWPGSDGDNARRLQSAIQCTPDDAALTANRMWYFFQQLSGGKKLALSHGGNMVGATSFCFLVPSLNQAVVVLCNTRGFYLDAANMTCMFLADALARKVTDLRTIKNLCGHLDTIIRLVKGDYIHHLGLYETKLEDEYPQLAWASDFAACVGKFQLVPGVFAEIQGHAREALKFRLYGKGFEYPLRVRYDCSTASSEVTMTFAMSMKDLVPLGVGGNNRLNIRDFELVFRGRDGSGRLFGEFVWAFDRAGVHADGDVSAFAWKRVA
ncbi:beta-lactamase/transpeptidase-like protein [Cercophora samala]|uniref:Beta-lactamase/transpeptidase-like protein n=1 Tax=Cercophora samala TaxID=330535 RepID=A0AA39ZL49_9PEZI|nr:beta-lactamase/transpeptidase-like protein [Cercophora samala]